MGGGVERGTMRTSGGKALPSSRWPKVLSRVLTFLAAMVLSSKAMAAAESIALDARMLLLLGITLGIIAFAVGTAIVCLRATQRARRAEAAAASEAERYRLSESMLDTVVAAEPQLLLTVSEVGEAELLLATLPASYGVPHEAERFINFAAWLDAPSVHEFDVAIEALAERGEAFNLMVTTLRERYVEVDGRAAGRT